MTAPKDRPCARTARRVSLFPAKTLVTVLAAASLAGCAVGPDFHAPTVPEGKDFHVAALPAATVESNAPTGDAQRFLEGADVPARWWTTFGSDELDRRVEGALAHSPTVASAQAALRQAQEGVNAARGALLPSIDAGAGVTRTTLNSPTGSAFTLNNVGVDVGYTLDLFGGVRRGVEAQSALADMARYQLQGTYLSLAGNVATASFREAALRGQVVALDEIVGLYEEQLKLVETQHEIGAKSLGDVLAIRAQAAAARAQLPALRQQLAQTRNQLATYLGQFPSEAELDALELDALLLPTDIPVSLPSTVARQRPDVLAAEAELHRATAAVGIATANLYPQITLSANLGSQAADAGDLFGSGSKVWGIGANLLQPLFHGGSLRAQKRAAEAGLDKAVADYRQTLLTAFQNIADALRALELGAENLKAQAEAEAAASRSLDLVRVQYRDGAASYLQVLDATRNYQQARIALIQARATRLADTAALYAALGGGQPIDPTKAAAVAAANESN